MKQFQNLFDLGRAQIGAPLAAEEPSEGPTRDGAGGGTVLVGLLEVVDLVLAERDAVPTLQRAAVGEGVRAEGIAAVVRDGALHDDVLVVGPREEGANSKELAFRGGSALEEGDLNLVDGVSDGDRRRWLRHDRRSREGEEER